MIGYVCGKIVLVNNIDGSVVVAMPSGIGYTIFVGTNSTLHYKCGNDANLFTETVVKEDSITLYGFDNYEKQVWFRSFLKVSGVGTKMAINIIDTFTMDSIVSALVNQNYVFFQAVSGLGEKVSQRIVSELKKEPAKNTKILGATECCKTYRSESIQVSNAIIPKADEKQRKTKKNDILLVNINDVVSALVNLGFDYNKSYNAAKIAIENEKTLEGAIVYALKKINE
jgi:Holliday junction DNA helicase RuvA